MLALIYGAVMIVNIALWNREIFGDLGTEGRALLEPVRELVPDLPRPPIEWLPAWPLFETMVGLFLVLGLIYYVIAVRGTAHDIEARSATGEMIG